MAVAEYVNIIQLVLDVLILGYIYSKYKIQKFNTLKYLLWGVSFLTLTSVFLVVLNPSSSGIRGSFVQSGFSLVFMILAIYCILIFIESFSLEDPFTKGYLRLGVFIIITITGFMVISLIISSANPDEFFLNAESTTSINISDLTPTEAAVYGLFATLSLLSLLLALIEIILLFRKLKFHMDRTHNPLIRSNLKKMRFSLLFIIIGSTFLAFADFMTNFVILVGISFFIFFYVKGGLFMFQEETLRRLIIIDDLGIPYYAYKFQAFEHEDGEAAEEDQEDVLFSGALKAVSNLFASLTGAKQSLKEILLEKNTLLIRGMMKDSKQYSVLLIVDQSNSFFRDALDAFSSKLETLDVEIIPNQTLLGSKKEAIDSLIKESFGLISN